MDKKSYEEIISVVRGDIKNLEELILEDKFFSEIILKQLIQAPAKRIRSAIAFLFLHAYGKEITKEQLELQCAVELAHTASLIHDDVIDGSEKRRNMYTLNTMYGDKYAILTGDYILSVALNKIISLNKNNITQDFIQVFSEMSLGELSQLKSQNQIPKLPDYIHKTEQKTAGLFKVSLKSSAILAGLNEAIKRLEIFGLRFGTAFQIKNDLKDLQYDIQNGIYTAPIIFSQDPEAITPTSIRDTKNLINRNLDSLFDIVEGLPNNKYKNALRDLLELYKE